MNPVFSSTITDQYGDVWPNAMTRVDDVEVVKPGGYHLKAQDDDSYKKEESKVDDNAAPVTVLYSTEFWSKQHNKVNGKPSRQFSNGETVFTIDFTRDDVKAQWTNGPEDYDECVLQLCQWHFTHRVLKGL